MTEGLIPPALASFYESVGPLPSAPAAPPTDFSPVEEMSLPPMDTADGAGFLQENLPGTDPVEHERDILYVVNYAMEHGKCRTMSDMVGWLQRQLAYAQREGQWQQTDRYKQAPPDILQLAGYLRRQSMTRRY